MHLSFVKCINKFTPTPLKKIPIKLSLSALLQSSYRLFLHILHSLFSDTCICQQSLILSPYKPKKNTKMSALSYRGVAENYCLWFNQLKDSLRGNTTTTLFPVANWVLNKQSTSVLNLASSLFTTYTGSLQLRQHPNWTGIS